MQELPPEAAFRAAPFLPRYCGKFLQRKYFVAGPPVCGAFFAILQEMRRPGKGGATKHTMNTKTYPRTNDRRTIYLNTVIDNPYIEVGDYTIYNDFVNDPAEFEKNNVLSTTRSTRTGWSSANSAPSPAARGSCSTARTTRSARWPITPFRSSSRSGNSTGRTSPRRGTTRATSSSATTYGSVTKRSSWRASGSATAP